ncbi:MAG: MBL fold metallo-hydrolase RNA specificity domain-containing protein [Candidatus Shapirobacteria bacterium]
MIKEIENGKVERKTAEVIWADGNSSHASGHELIDFYKRFNLNSLENFILGHGREPARETGSREIQKEDFAEYTSIFLPKLRQIVAIG